jgi:hypothetical protein
LASSEKPITQERISEIVGLPLEELLFYPRIMMVLQEVPGIDSNSHVRDLMKQLHQVVEELESREEPVRIGTFEEMLGIHSPSLYPYPLIRQFLEHIRKRQQIRQMDALVKEAEIVIDELETAGLPVTFESVGKAIGRRQSSLYTYLPIKELVREARERSKTAREERLVEQVEATVERLRESSEPVSQTAVANAVGMSLRGLKSRPQTRAILEQVGIDYQAEKKRQREKRDLELVDRIEQAAAELRLSGTPLTQKAIAEIAGVTVGTLRYYQKAREALQQAINGKAASK